MENWKIKTKNRKPTKQKGSNRKGTQKAKEMEENFKITIINFLGGEEKIIHPLKK